MTRASHQRLARRAERHAFRMPPPGMLSEQVDLEPYGLVLGLIHPEDLPLLIGVWTAERFTQLLPEQATAWADELVAAGQAVPLAPVIEAIRRLVKRASDIAGEVIMRQLEVAGSA